MGNRLTMFRKKEEKIMKKKKNVKKSKGLFKVGVISAIATVSCFAIILMASASSYSFYLQLNQGGTARSTERNFTDGVNYVKITPNSVESVDGLSYTMVGVNLVDTGEVSRKTNYIVNRFNTNEIGVTIPYDFGYRNQGKRYWTFSTKVEGYRYGAIKANVETSSN